ncbi:MAG: ArsR family transcriptional regulator [Desulfopila sp.]|jgi:DNA-binding transcriptional ArsR family regulator|nr:ArsR family transcriptional regulator [Desulfopila sp.]
MQLGRAAQRMAELGNITRLSIIRLLVKSGPSGLRVGEIQEILEIPASTLSHHLSRLINVGLIEQQRKSNVLYCMPQIPVVKELAEYLLSECCSGDTNIKNL